MSAKPSTTDARRSDADTAPEGEGHSRGVRVANTAQVVASPAAARYQRGKELARGGLGRVTSALDRTLQREVAIKELHQRTEQGVRRFVREGLTMARLQHPAIVPILDAGTWEGGDPFLVMKLLEGKTLTEELAARTTPEARIALLPNLLAVADALGFAHERGVVHRDVKPSNIMVGAHGETVLLDWGVAFDTSASKLETDGRGRSPEPIELAPDTEEQLTIDGALTGTARYMSPEQANDEPPVPGFDVYSFGVTMFEVLRGDGPADLAAIIAKAMAPPGERYAHAGLLADDLRKYIAGQLVSAKQYTRRELVARWLRRNRVYIAAAGVALAVIAVVATVAVRSVVRERNVAVTRTRELVLLQARANLRVDPTATIAWLKQYPEGAPRQDEVLALVDEAASRGVARHVLRSTSQPVDVKLTPDSRALIAAHRDGTLVRVDLATGTRRELAAHTKPWLLVRPLPDAVMALDQDGVVYRVAADGALERRQTIALPERPVALLHVPRTNELKLLFPDAEAMFVPIASLAPARETVLGELADYEFVDDGGTDTTALVLQPTGGLFVLATPPRRLWQFSTGTWLGSSASGGAYLAIVPGPKGRGMGEDVSIWVGTVTGGPPVRLGAMPACGMGTDRFEEAQVSDDAGAAVVKRCGAMTLFAGGTARTLRYGEHADTFEIAPDGARLLVSRGSTLELTDLRTGASRELASTETVTAAGFDASWLYSVGGDRGTRVWPAAAATGRAIGALGRTAAPVRLVATATPGMLTIVRHLECAQWRVPERAMARSFGLSPARSRDLDDDRMRWPLDIAPGGNACAFAAVHGAVTVVGPDGANPELRDARELTECVLSHDATRATCLAGDAIATFDVASGRVITRREVARGTLRGIARFRDRVVVLVAGATGCALEDAGGKRLASLAQDCQRVRASASQAGRESALLVSRPTAVDVWTEAGVLAVPTEASLVEVSSAGLVAVAREQTVEVWDLHTHARRTAPPPHARAIERLAWSPRGILAAADNETIRLWDPRTRIVRVISAPHTQAIAWSAAGDVLFTSDGRTVDAWSIDMANGASPGEVRDRLDQLTSARIIDGRVATP